MVKTEATSILGYTGGSLCSTSGMRLRTASMASCPAFCVSASNWVGSLVTLGSFPTSVTSFPISVPAIAGWTDSTQRRIALVVDGKIVWMMMPFCELGDLNNFYRKRDVPRETNLNMMKQITAGVSYLHSQNIIHRDIKPGNILVASVAPLRLLLTDFDISKCLDPAVETSLMTSNVGTLAFKAPEFFQRTSPGKIEYHRNVDIYAAGLTFLAMLQAEKGKKMLNPRTETPMEDSEFHAPSIGLLISERIKYKVPELSIVKIEGEQRSLKSLISQMTCVNPEERILDLQKSADNIRRTAYSYSDSYQSRVSLKRAAADMRDILSKMETVEQYMTQQS